MSRQMTYPNSGSPSAPVVPAQAGEMTNRVFPYGVSFCGEMAPVPNTETLSANKTIAVGDPWLQQITPGAARNVTLPATSNKFWYRIVNRATSASHIITVKDASASTVGTIGPTQAADVMSDGTTVTISRLEPGTTGFTDSSGGTASTTIAAGVGCATLAFFINLADIANGDLLTNYVPGYAFKILKVDFRVSKPVTTAAKATTLNMEIGTTDLTGGVVALTSANCTPAGAAVAGTSVTAANTGTSTDSFSIEAASTTTFVEGNGWIVVEIQNMDVANAFASIAARS